MEELRKRPERDAILRVQTSILPNDTSASVMVREPRFLELRADPEKMRQFEDTYRVKLERAYYWEDMMK
jgi:hypothetical protein